MLKLHVPIDWCSRIDDIGFEAIAQHETVLSRLFTITEQAVIWCFAEIALRYDQIPQKTLL
jgi:hypothetical protein